MNNLPDEDETVSEEAAAGTTEGVAGESTETTTVKTDDTATEAAESTEV